MEATCVQKNKLTVCTIIHVCDRIPFSVLSRSYSDDSRLTQSHTEQLSLKKKKVYFLFLGLYSDSFTKQ